MQAYSVYDREVGYCQGSPFITGMLLMQQVRGQSAAVTSVVMMMSLSHYCWLDCRATLQINTLGFSVQGYLSLVPKLSRVS